MQADLPVFATDEEALTAAVQHAGGAKVVGCALWPDLSPDTAQRKLLDALNQQRPERLKPSQVRLVLRMARDRALSRGGAVVYGRDGLRGAGDRARGAGGPRDCGSGRRYRDAEQGAGDARARATGAGGGMSILQGLIPTYTTRHAISSMERLPRKPVVVRPVAVIKGLNKRVATMDYLRQHPTALRRDVAAACGVSKATVDLAIRALKDEGKMAVGRRTAASRTRTLQARLLDELRNNSTGSPADLMNRLDVSANKIYEALRCLKDKGHLSCKVTYTWTVKA